MGSLQYVNADGVTRVMHYDEAEPEVFHVKTTVDCTQLIDNNRFFADLHPNKSMNKLVARVPLTVYETSIHENWDEDDWKKWLNDPDNKYFRIWPGRV